MKDPAAAAYGSLLYARMMLEAANQAGGSYPLADALSLTEDAISQIRGELNARQGERPIVGAWP
jgi:hypothetical protein